MNDFERAPSSPADTIDLPPLELSKGLVSRRIFADEEIYKLEQTRVFRRSWVCVGFESLIPQSGDYYTTTLGDDPVIVSRDQRGQVHVLLNTCRHRGNKVCLFPRGNTDFFTCSYHNWKYASDGSLKNVPYVQGAYFGDLQLSDWGLVAVPHVETYRDLIFASWDPLEPTLDAYLGDMKWYLDHLVLAAWGGGIEVMAGPFCLRLNANWKIMAENNVGDHYHSPFTHRSLFRLNDNMEREGMKEGLGQEQPADGPFEVSVQPHGIGGIRMGEAYFKSDMQAVEELHLGKEVREYVRERWEIRKKALAELKTVPYCASHGNVFPNLSFSGFLTSLSYRGFFIQQPRGPMHTETWQCVVVERDAPDVVKELSFKKIGDEGQLATGLFAQDDAENFERVTASAMLVGAQDFPFHVGMGLRQEGRWPDQESWLVEGLPGLVGPRFSEHSQRRMYRRWGEMMGCDVR